MGVRGVSVRAEGVGRGNGGILNFQKLNIYWKKILGCLSCLSNSSQRLLFWGDYNREHV